MDATEARPLEGKVALVTGGGVRLGQAMALGLGRWGAKVAVHFNGSAAAALHTIEQVNVDGNGARAFQADLTDEAQVISLVERVDRELGPVAIVVNSAALFERAPLHETPAAMADRLWALNARAPLLVSREVVKRCRGRGLTDIVNMVDVGGAFNAWRNYAAYGMTKAAMRSLTETLALELAPDVRVNGIAPGTVLPPADMSPKTLETLRQRIPQQRFGSPDDIVETLRYLLLGSRFVTGQIIAVDGGRTLETGARDGG
ncbi:MAG: SDR family oxidoreductase [Myxococcaceae bacterium]|nr:SDR family oxidoreductase [Myxococcaceae bacterium]